MKIDDLYTHELCEDENPETINKIADMLRKDGFDISDFTLVSTISDTYEFIKDSNPDRGFLIFYDSRVLISPIPQYQLHCGCVYFSFDARSITEAYLLHNKEISEEEYHLLNQSYSKTEGNVKPHAMSFSEKFGIEAACEAFNFTKEFLET
ncbi:hypothetical protein [Butyrivibrio fibrisolvens]|uniref:hypothetical protein n=1 Tax=Butyrivibrio fibrisolvens TaxID=831 RepID=UPI0003B39441|nr:hypothetical protein [Butyrivibrio fibrisolvens]